MRVAHLIPSAFDYFDDIRKAAFELVETLEALGAAVDVFTLQYGTTVAAGETPATIQASAPGRMYRGVKPITEIIASLESYDIVHLHVPFLGAAGKLVAWKALHSEFPLVVTCYQRFVTSDVLSFFIKLYNLYYLPKLFALADVITVPSLTNFAADYSSSFKQFPDKTLEVDESAHFIERDLTYDPTGIELIPAERLAFKYLLVYNEITY